MSDHFRIIYRFKSLTLLAALAMIKKEHRSSMIRGHDAGRDFSFFLIFGPVMFV